MNDSRLSNPDREMRSLELETNALRWAALDASARAHGWGDPLPAARGVAKALSYVIPDTWTDVRVSPDPAAHVQISGRDVRGRRQYRYHPDWHAAQVELKYERLLAFVRALPRLRERVDADLSGPGLAKERVAAALVRLLELALIGVAKEDRSLSRPPLSSALHERPGNAHLSDVQDRRRARVVVRWQDLPRQVSFHYLDDEDRRSVLVPADVEAYMRAAMGEAFSAKELRAWAGIAFNTAGRAEIEALESTRAIDHEALSAAEPVARRLGRVALRRGDTTVPAAVLEAHVHGSLARTRREVGYEVSREGEVKAAVNPPRPTWRAAGPILEERRAPAPHQDGAKTYGY